jgi:hypothetical protein
VAASGHALEYVRLVGQVKHGVPQAAFFLRAELQLLRTRCEELDAAELVEAIGQALLSLLPDAREFDPLRAAPGARAEQVEQVQAARLDAALLEQALGSLAGLLRDPDCADQVLLVLPLAAAFSRVYFAPEQHASVAQRVLKELVTQLAHTQEQKWARQVLQALHESLEFSSLAATSSSLQGICDACEAAMARFRALPEQQFRKLQKRLNQVLASLIGLYGPQASRLVEHFVRDADWYEQLATQQARPHLGLYSTLLTSAWRECAHTLLDAPLVAELVRATAADQELLERDLLPRCLPPLLQALRASTTPRLLRARLLQGLGELAEAAGAAIAPQAGALLEQYLRGLRENVFEMGAQAARAAGKLLLVLPALPPEAARLLPDLLQRLAAMLKDKFMRERKQALREEHERERQLRERERQKEKERQKQIVGEMGMPPQDPALVKEQERREREAAEADEASEDEADLEAALVLAALVALHDALRGPGVLQLLQKTSSKLPDELLQHLLHQLQKDASLPAGETRSETYSVRAAELDLFVTLFVGPLVKNKPELFRKAFPLFAASLLAAEDRKDAILRRLLEGALLRFLDYIHREMREDLIRPSWVAALQALSSDSKTRDLQTRLSACLHEIDAESDPLAAKVEALLTTLREEAKSAK